MNRKRTPEQAEAARAQVLALVKIGPTSGKVLAKHLNCTPRTMEHFTQHLRNRGLIEAVRNAAGYAMWCTPDAAKKLRAIEAQRHERLAELKAKREADALARHQRHMAELDAQIEREESGDHDDKPVVRWVPASSVRAQVSGPRWVFDLGAA